MKNVFIIFLVACNSDEKNEEEEMCLTPCNKVYQECGILRPGATSQELVDYCVAECEEALLTPGEVGNYDPFQQNLSSEKPELENDEQATLWIECIEQTSCDLFEDNYCEPIW